MTTNVVQATEKAPAKVADERYFITDTTEFSNLLDTARFAHLQRLAEIFSKSMLVPKHFQNDMPSTFVGMQMALRLGIDPMMFLQNSFIVHGRPGVEGKLVIALINRSGLFDGPLRWKFSGIKGQNDFTCTCYAKHLKTGEILESSVSWEMVVAEGWNRDKQMQGGGVQKSKWNTLPDLMFRYRSATFFGRTYCPEVLMGLETKDELNDIPEERDITPVARIAEPATQARREEDARADMLAAIRGIDPGFDATESLDEFVQQSGATFGASPVRVMDEATENIRDFLEAFQNWNKPAGDKKDEKAAAAENGQPESQPKTERRTRRTRFPMGDEPPMLTCGITPQQIASLQGYMNAYPAIADGVRDYLANLGQPDLTYLKADEAQDLIGRSDAYLVQIGGPQQQSESGDVCPNTQQPVDALKCDTCKDRDNGCPHWPAANG